MELPSPTPTSTPTSTSTSTALSAPYPAAGPSFSGGSVAAGLLLAAMAAGALVLARRRRTLPRLVEIVESASLGPKRSLVVVRLGDEVLVLGSSEGGITLLATRPAAALMAAATNASSFSLSPDGGEGGVRGPAPTRTATAAQPLSPALSPLSRGEGGVSLLDRLKRRPRPDGARSFDAALAESVEDVELRRKLAAGRTGSVR